MYKKFKEDYDVIKIFLTIKDFLIEKSLKKHKRVPMTKTSDRRKYVPMLNCFDFEILISNSIRFFSS
jgi:hypothetical protein